MSAWETTAPHSRYVAEKFPPVPGYALRNISENRRPLGRSAERDRHLRKSRIPRGRDWCRNKEPGAYSTLVMIYQEP